MFGFRIIKMEDGTEIIDSNLKTPYNALTALQLLEHIEVDNYMETMEREKRRTRKETEVKRKKENNPFYKFLSFCMYPLTNM